MTKVYKDTINSISPVAVKQGQTDIHAPEHDTWKVIACDVCDVRFAVGPNRIYGSRTTAQQCIDQTKTILAADHKAGRNHANSYELEG